MKNLSATLLLTFWHLAAHGQVATVSARRRPFHDSHATAAPARPPVSPYVGLGVLYGGYQVNHADVKMDYPVPLLVAGLQVGRISAQLVGAYYQPGVVVNRSTYQDYSTTPASTRYFTNNSELRSYLFPFVVRYGLLAPDKKFQVEPGLGFLAAYSKSSNSSTTTNAAGTVLFHNEGGFTSADSGLLLGIGLRYTPLAHVALTADAWTSFYRQAYFPAALPAASVGIRYQFRRVGQ